MANTMWKDGNKDLKVTIKMDDLTMFAFADGNISEWVDREDLEVTYSMDDEAGSILSREEAAQLGADEFCLRLVVVPKTHRGCSINVGAHPATRGDLRQRLGENANTAQTPHFTLAIQEAAPNGGKSTAKAALALFTRQELAEDGYGIAVIPWLDCSAEGEEDVVLPSGDEVKEATMLFMRKSTALVAATTIASLETRMRNLLAGKAAPAKNPPHVFPTFSPSTDGGVALQC